MKNKRKIDWEKLQNLKDEEIDYSDIPETDEEFWKDAVVVQPLSKKRITIYIDEDTLDYLKNNSKQYQTYINSILRSFVSHKKKKIRT